MLHIKQDFRANITDFRDTQLVYKSTGTIVSVSKLCWWHVVAHWQLRTQGSVTSNILRILLLAVYTYTHTARQTDPTYS